jgi:hypothetical protein
VVGLGLDHQGRHTRAGVFRAPVGVKAEHPFFTKVVQSNSEGAMRPPDWIVLSPRSSCCSILVVFNGFC